jgi:hypothetical protein
MFLHPRNPPAVVVIAAVEVVTIVDDSVDTGAVELVETEPEVSVAIVSTGSFRTKINELFLASRVTVQKLIAGSATSPTVLVRCSCSLCSTE